MGIQWQDGQGPPSEGSAVVYAECPVNTGGCRERAGGVEGGFTRKVT